MDRSQLPFRRVTEGYFVCDEGMIFARDTGKGYLELPGGGVDGSETPEQSLLREAFEEAGITACKSLKKFKELVTHWAPVWAVTEKQKKRYLEFQGEHISFFVARAISWSKPKGDAKTGEVGWPEPRRIRISEAIRIVEAGRPFHPSIRSYRESQLEILRSLL